MDHYSKPKGWLVAAWILSVLALIVSFPIAFIIGLFSSDDASGATVIWSYLIILAPLLLLVLPICAQVSYRRTKYIRTKWFSSAAILFCMAVAVLVAYLGFLALGMPFT